jgi:hypothetical protein
MTPLNEIKDRIARGYKGELLYNFRTSTYEITTWLEGAINIDQKLHKFSKDAFTSNTLKRAVYGLEYATS